MYRLPNARLSASLFNFNNTDTTVLPLAIHINRDQYFIIQNKEWKQIHGESQEFLQ